MSELVVVTICLGLNAIFSCIEMAFVTVSRPHLKKLAGAGSLPAKRVLHLRQNPERTLSVLQVGITVVGAVSAAVGGAGAEEHLGPVLVEKFGVSSDAAEYLSILIIVLPLSYVSVVVGELVPKSVALRLPTKFALAGGALLIAMDKAFAPFVYLLEISTKVLTRFLFSWFKSEENVDTSKEVDIDKLTESHKRYVFNLIAVDKRTVKDIMVEWTEVTKVDISEHFYRVFEKIKSSRHTRLPVTENEKVIGLLHTKEFVSETELSKLDWTELIRPIITVAPKDPILHVLKKLQSNRSHMAVVLEEEEPVGVVTIEDIFEEIVGDMFDEDDSPRSFLSNSRLRAMRLKKIR